MSEVRRQSQLNIAAGVNPAAMQQAEESDRFRDVDQHIQYLETPLSQLKGYLPYLTQHDVDSEKLVQIENNLNAISSLLEEIKNDVRAEEFDRIATASVSPDEVRQHEIQQYTSAYNVYQAGDWKRARSKFKVLARTAKDLEVRKNAIKSVQMIDEHDWGE